MSKYPFHPDPSDAWARLRFSIVGPLLSSPARRGELCERLRRLAREEWRHPTTGRPTRFSVSTIERWYYQARKSADPVEALRRKGRRDRGEQWSLGTKLKQELLAQHRRHGAWSLRLHYDNLAALAESDRELDPLPSYATVVRYMNAHGLTRRKTKRRQGSPGAALAERRLERWETRGFEVEHVNALWHLDFHHGSCKILLPSGQWVRPILLGILDDCSRLTCHAQWYLSETAETLIHGLSQAFQKRGLPRALMTDNGGAMTASEATEGLHRLSIVHEKTLPYSPHQNGKQETFWSQVEGRLVAMLDGAAELSLTRLNEATAAWFELDYNRRVHGETRQRPIDRFVSAPDVGRPCPSSEALRQAFTAQVRRTQRRSDGTISIQGVRFEVPSRYAHLKQLCVRYASWNLSEAFLVDERSGNVLCRLRPQDRIANADGRRRPCSPTPPASVEERNDKPAAAPLLEKLLAEYQAAGLAPAYLPKDEQEGPRA
jgi:transposase InsO family protein